MTENIERKIVLNILDNYIDPLLNDYGFKRRKNSIVYSRKINDCVQKIDFVYHKYPYYNPRAVIRIYPDFSIYFKELNEEVRKIFANYESDHLSIAYTLKALDKFTVHQPIEMCPKKTVGYIYDENEYIETAVEIKELLQEFTLPLLESCNTIDGFISEFEQHEENRALRDYTKQRMIFDDKQKFCVIAAYMLTGRRDKGFEVLNKYYNKKGLQYYYQPIFNYYHHD